MPLITCNNVSLAYDGKLAASELDFTVNSGDFLCIVGENGSGKSTLIKALLGLMKPIAGDISFGEGLVPNEIGYLPQQTVIQKDFPASIYEVVLSGCQNSRGVLPFYSHNDKIRAVENMKKLGIYEMRNHCYRELSGGQQQRVLLARALCATHKLLLLDEPVTGLDPVVTADLYRLICALNSSEGITIIMVSHDVSSAVRIASHILHLKHTPLFFGKREDYIESDAGRSFLGGDSFAS